MPVKRVYTLEDAKVAVQGQRALFEPKRARFPAVLGKGDDANTVVVPNRGIQWHYARPRGIGGPPQVVYNDVTAARSGLKVIIERDPAQPEFYRVAELMIDVPGYLDEEEMPEGGGLKRHHSQHEFYSVIGGEDIVFVADRQILGCRVGASDPGDLNVVVGWGYVQIGQTGLLAEAATIDLSSYVPESGHRWVIITAADTGSPYGVGEFRVTAGEVRADARFAYWPKTEINEWRLAAVRLAADETAITDWPEDVDIIDLRFCGATMGTEWNKTAIVGASGAQYTSINTACSMVSTGEAHLVYVMPGTYLEDVIIPDGVSLVGVDAKQCLILGFVATACDSGDIQIANLSIHNVGVSNDLLFGLKLCNPDNVQVERVDIYVENDGAGGCAAAWVVGDTSDRVTMFDVYAQAYGANAYGYYQTGSITDVHLLSCLWTGELYDLYVKDTGEVYLHACDYHVAVHDVDAAIYNVLGLLGDLDNVDTVGAVQGSYLRYDIATAQWIVGTGGPADPTQILLRMLGSPTYQSLQDWVDVTQSAGRISGGAITDKGDGTIDVAAGTGFIKSSDVHVDSPMFFDWPAVAGLAPANNTHSWVYVDYSGGVPTVRVTDDIADIDRNTTFIVAELWRANLVLHILEKSQNVYNLSARTERNLTGAFGFQRGSGLIVTESGAARTVDMSEGLVYRGLNEIVMAALDTDPGGAADTFIAFYRDGGGGWTEVAGQSAISNTQYDDGSGALQNLNPNHYGVFWVYLDFDGELFIQYGQDDYVLGPAEAASVPATMPLLSSFALLIARVIVEQGAANFTSVAISWDVHFNFAEVATHNNLGGLQGGAVGEYYHLTNAQHVAVGAMVTAGLDSLTAAEVDQLENIGLITISAAQWGHLGAMDQGVATGDATQFGGVSIRTAALVGWASGLYVPWIVGDVDITARFGDSNVANDQTAVYAEAGSGTGVVGQAGSGDGVWAYSATGVAIIANLTGAGTAIAQFKDNGATVFQVNDGGTFSFLPAGAEDFTITANSFNVLTGSYITMADATWIGIGVGDERIVFDAAGYVAVMGADFGVGIATPEALLHAHGSTAVIKLTGPLNVAGTYFGTNDAAGQIYSAFAANRNPDTGAIDNANMTAPQINLFSGNADSHIAFYTSAVNNVVGTEQVRINKAGKVGLKTATIPHGGVGSALLALEGANASVNGPHVQFTTATDDYPLMQIFPWSHDNIAIFFDCYFDGATRSSDAGSNFSIYKNSDKLFFYYDSAIDPGDALTWNTDCYLDTTGVFHANKLAVGIAVPLAKCHIDQASATATIPVLTLDQADESEEFINFISAAGANMPIDDTSPALNYWGVVRIAVNGVFKRLAVYDEV